MLQAFKSNCKNSFFVVNCVVFGLSSTRLFTGIVLD